MIHVQASAKGKMPPYSPDVPFKGSLKFKYPKNRDISWKNADTWLGDKRNDDGAEGLWRVHNNLYDVSDFIKRHPGGPMWLEKTKGTDITEAFECHHLSTKPEKILETFFVREAKAPRNSPFTFEDDGLFRTLKRRLVPIVATIPKNASWVSDITIDLLCLATFVLSALSAAFWNYTLGFIAGVCLCFTTISSHNYFHRRDNFRMYYFDLSLLSFRDWRITHALSHHLYPNTVIDFEISFIEPWFQFLPHKKSWSAKYGPWFLAIIMWINLFTITLLQRIFGIVYLKNTKLHWSNLIPFTLPITMCLFSGHSVSSSLWFWLYVISCGSFSFSFIAFTAAHHHPAIFHDGDKPRSYDKYDWGLYQLDSVAERRNVRRSTFLILTTFGDHALHHIFPTLDHGALKYLYGEFEKVMNEFGTDLQLKSEVELIKGQFLQLARDEPNPKPPGCVSKDLSAEIK